MPDTQPETKAEEKKPNKAGGIGCLVLIAVAVMVGFYSCSGSTNTNTPSRSGDVITLPSGTTIDQFRAQVMCESQIKDRLVSPGSAKFQRPNRTKSGNTWVIESAVDSQNAFGALLRSEWRCVIDGTADTIRVTQVR